MEEGEESSPQHGATTVLSSSLSLPAILQKPSVQPSALSGMIQQSVESHPGLHAPAALRPAAVSAIPTSNHNQSAAQYPHGSMSHVAPGLGAMRMYAARPEPLKRKRGRPRKYAEGTGGNISLAFSPRPSAQGPLRRGRPPGSGKKQQLAALGSAGQGFTPHAMTIAAGEDVATKIMSFSQVGPRAVCILSANGVISNVTLRQPATAGGTVTYEGRFEILSLSGSFLLTEDGGRRSRTGGLSVSLAGPDGCVIGGGVAGMLMAAGPVQVVVGSFIAEARKTPVRVTSRTSEHAASLSSPAPSVPTITSPGKSDTSVPKSPSSPPLDQVPGRANIDTFHSQGQSMTYTQQMAWAGTQSMSESRYDTDINMPLPGG